MNTGSNLGPSPTYQWYANNNVISGATSDSYVANSVSSTDVFSLLVGSSAACPSPAFVMSNYTNRETLLPIKMSSFTVASVGPDVKVSWETSMEVNVGHYEVMRSEQPGLKDFKTVASVAARNAATGGSYSYTDAVPGNGTYYYLIKSTDLDGSSELSDVREVSVNGSKSSLSVIPNPVVSSAVITGLETGSAVMVVNMNGQVVKSGVCNSQSYAVDASGLPSGVYIVKVVGRNGSSRSVKFIKI